MPRGGTPRDENALDSPFLKGAKAFRPEGDVPAQRFDGQNLKGRRPQGCYND